MQRNEAIGILFQQLAQANGNCNTRYASNVLQTLSLLFPKNFNEPITFDLARDSLQHLSIPLIRTLVEHQGFSITEEKLELNETELSKIKEYFDEAFQTKAKEYHPNISQEHIQKFMAEFIEPEFKALVELALEKTSPLKRAARQ